MAATTATVPPYIHYVEPKADAAFPAEKGRYHLYVTYACPFACRALLARNLKGLQNVVDISVAHSVFQKTKPDDESDTHQGWAFFDPQTTPLMTARNGQQFSTDGCIPDTVKHTKFVRDLYELVDKTPRKFSVPLLWDKKKQTIVCNESADILRMFNSGFGELASSEINLLPTHLVSEIEKLNDGLLMTLSGGFYKMAYARDDVTYQEGLTIGLRYLDEVEEILSTKRYLAGNTITESDVRLFGLLIRLDTAQRESNVKNLTTFPNIVSYLRDLYQMPAVKATVHWQHIKNGLMNTNIDINKMPVGPFVDYEAPHDRNRFN